MYKSFSVLVIAGLLFQHLPAEAAPAPKKVAARASSQRPSQAVKPTRVAVLRFTGPVIWDLDADEFWKIKNHTGAPTEGDLATIPDVLQSQLADRLSTRLGSTVVPNPELQRFQSHSAPTVNQSEQFSTLRNRLGVRYVLTGTIDRLEWDGNTATPDDYIIIISTRLIDTATGQMVWSQDLRKFKSEAYTKASGKNVLGVFSSRHIPEVAEAVSSEIAGALGR